MRAALGLVVAVLALAGCSTMEKLNPVNWFASAPKVKPAELGPISPSARLAVLWQGSAGSAGAYVLTPAVVGSTVYAAGHDGALTRYDNGSQAWRIDAGRKISGGVGANGRLVAVATPKGEVLAFDDSGKALWTARVSSEVLAAPLVSEDGLVLVRSGDNRIFAFDAADGKRKWVYQRSTPALSLRSNVGVAIAGKMLLAGFPGGKLVAIALNNGAAVWEATVALPRGATELERVADVTSAPVAGEREVCAVAFQGRVACFDLASGNHLWSRDLSSTAGLDMDERALYVADDKGAVHALDRINGATLWKQDKLFMRRLSRPLALGGHVAVGDYQGFVHLLARDSGEFAARLATDGSGIAAEPQRLARGFLVQTRNGGLYALAAE
ncbi:MAG TPA: outer membrane protein assembly factor BamB [Candidatus Desulfobacillus sp.]|nr:outer membrane protein assembly factor BamB [Candidatus Desulfobacillus sp.]